MSKDDVWGPVPLDDPIQRHPTQWNPTLVLEQLPHLPFEQMEWENFERILWRTMYDVEGLRHAQIYGRKGQAQQGLDVVALTPGTAGVALQAKRYQDFKAADLRKAVEKFAGTQRPFPVERLIIGISVNADHTGVVTELRKQREKLHPTRLDLWDRQELSRLLRREPLIVVEHFGLETAKRFCSPFELEQTVIPAHDTVVLSQAITRSPEAVTGARELLERAATIDADPEQTLGLVEQAQDLLRESNFGTYAAMHNQRRAELLAELGRHAEALRDVVEELWEALDLGQSTTAESLRHRAMQLLPGGSKDPELLEMIRVIEVALAMHSNPLGVVPADLDLTIGNDADRSRLAVLSGEIARASGDDEWILDHRRDLDAAAEIADEGRAVRIQILIAEATTDWEDLLTQARQGRLPLEYAALVAARFARFSALSHDFREAETNWEEATRNATLVRRFRDASRWVLSRRVFRSRWKPFTINELLPLQLALQRLDPSSDVVPIARDAYERALEELRDGKLRSAAIAGQRALRQAIVVSDWMGEEKARRILAEIYEESGNLTAAAQLLIRAGDIRRAEALVKAHPSVFLDVMTELDDTAYWIVATAYRVLAAEADVIPDSRIPELVERLLSDLEDAEQGRMVTMHGSTSSRYLALIAIIAAIADRIGEIGADAVLSHFERQGPIAEGHYRYHDEDQALAVARIAAHHAPLRARALANLVPLLQRSQPARKIQAVQVIETYFEEVRELLEVFSDHTEPWAREVLTTFAPKVAPTASAEQAFDRLTQPLKHDIGVYTIGTGAVGDASMLTGADESKIEAVIAEQLRRSIDQKVGSSDRGDYLLAAAYAADQLPGEAPGEYFQAAMERTLASTPSEHDELIDDLADPFGTIHADRNTSGPQGKALFLAACLASTQDERRAVRSRAFMLIEGNDSGDYWPARALQRVEVDLAADIAYLSAQTWSLRSLAAALWAEHVEPEHVGVRLARDPDVRVRRALAAAVVSREPNATRDLVAATLQGDPAYSVRSSIGGP